MKIEFHPDALAEFEDSASYYAGCQDGLGLRFVACVESALRQISESPTRWRIFEADIRRALVPVFPYAVLYSLENGFVLVLAVMHCSREPGYWHGRAAPQL